jgi:hypothetical protein
MWQRGHKRVQTPAPTRINLRGRTRFKPPGSAGFSAREGLECEVRANTGGIVS